MDKNTIYELKQIITDGNYIFDDFHTENDDQIKAYSYLVYLSLLDFYESRGIYDLEYITEDIVYKILIDIKNSYSH